MKGKSGKASRRKHGRPPSSMLDLRRFLEQDTGSSNHKKKIKRLINYFSFKLRNFVSPKDSKRLKRQTTPWMSYYRYMLPTKDLAPAFPQINKKNQTTRFKKGQRLDQDLPQSSHLSGQLPVSRCSMSLPCREIQTRTTVR